MSFLIDSGAEVSTIPKCSSLAEASKSDTKWFAANGSPIQVFGEVLLKLNLNLRREFVWKFVIADVSQAIIGADFLSVFDLLPDLNRHRLLDRRTALKTMGSIKSINTPNISTINKFQQNLHLSTGLLRPDNRYLADQGGYHLRSLLQHELNSSS
ncbi:PREDICTED: uncharacterized protein LOC108965141 [Bactrocera latifrons]|uniref:uncharacterized protein LOC108965141 n=1 Tax=Bactrocera latifrons TaxID=174628 RepID=UPI0008DE6FD3|nr:PREDICTED: uncharacterized protein LOC108965141 [Bactrocera latifrons]